MKIDLHVHASERSGCSVSGEEEIIQTAIDNGLDGLVFTDHHRLVAFEHLEELNKRYAPFRIFGGVEITLDEGEDVLVLGVHDPSFEERDWTYPALFNIVRNRNGFLALAHPFRYGSRIAIDIERYRPDAIEARSVHIGIWQAELIEEVCTELDLPGLFNSDAHRAQHVGIYSNELEHAVETEDELLVELRAGNYTLAASTERIVFYNQQSDKRQLPLADLAERSA